MSELRPPTHDDLNAFPNLDDMYDFADLIEIDETWRKIYDPTYETIEAQDLADEEKRLLQQLDHPDIREHIIGHVYSWQFGPDDWVSISKILYTFAGDHRYRSLPAVDQKVLDITTSLKEQGMLTRFYSMYQLGPNAPVDKFPQLAEEFEDWVTDFLSTHTLSSPPWALVLHHFAEDVTPFEYWAGKRKLFEMVRRGTLILDDAKNIALPVREDPELALTLDAIDVQLKVGSRQPLMSASGRSLSAEAELQLRQLSMGVRLRKPQQRGSDGGVGRQRR